MCRTQILLLKISIFMGLFEQWILILSGILPHNIYKIKNSNPPTEVLCQWIIFVFLRLCSEELPPPFRNSEQTLQELSGYKITFALVIPVLFMHGLLLQMSLPLGHLYTAQPFAGTSCAWVWAQLRLKPTGSVQQFRAQTGVAQSHRKCNLAVLVVKNLTRTETTRVTPLTNTTRT